MVRTRSRTVKGVSRVGYACGRRDQVDGRRSSFESMVADALDSIPDELGVAARERRGHGRGLADAPTQLGGRRGTLLGLYEGDRPPRAVPLGYSGVMPDRITIFRGPLCARAARRGRRSPTQVRVTVLHEVGHYFGLSRRAPARARLGVTARRQSRHAARAA